MFRSAAVGKIFIHLAPSTPQSARTHRRVPPGSADLLIIGGTSLAVYPAAGLIDYYRGNKLVLINMAATVRDGMADLIIKRKIGEALSEAVE